MTTASGVDSCSSWRTIRSPRCAEARQWIRRIESPGDVRSRHEVVRALTEVIGLRMQSSAGVAEQVGERRQLDDGRGDRRLRVVAEHRAPPGQAERVGRGHRERAEGVDAAPGARDRVLEFEHASRPR